MYICRKVQEDLSKELDLQIKGAEKPVVWELIGVRFILLPYTLCKVELKLGIWKLKFGRKQKSISILFML